ncbi:sigma-70 family RNA polymerase sigma factor [Pseudonocardia asaccharolytica]|uniref:DNA-directed RNA polymerase sigma-70 factor n=1 Tax=Pseudonocardia asaccharolytica DSM 44247 = NBRC 16224 TaxID=1123024 RepID=A0A511D663_9PSEU|nr:sigma-70 family RNA polymerase sigma factor [Pseudonocardia asaccharolytica]GEL19943.1 DNA-directed RNA polymerase sigma-70 factor [Pseudonocardia asaccharolytica DSM 44247 = NBRC 16224]
MAGLSGGTTLPRTAELDPRLEQHRRELAGYCYRMLGSAFETEDAVQETMIRAWRGLEGFSGRSSLRSWLYRIATNVCLDMLKGRKRRALPMDLTPSGPPTDQALGSPLEGGAWVEPIHDDRVLPATGDPAEMAVARESVRLAFVAALQHLPPRQRAVLILRDVLCWSASESAELLGASVASVNSALQRARATLASRDLTAGRPADPLDEEHRALLARYVAAFERFDVESLVALLHEDAVQTMPPYELWLRGRADIGAWMLGPGSGCRGSRLLPVAANGAMGFAAYRPSGPGGRHQPFSIQLPEVADGRITGITHFLGSELFELFGLPPHLDR